LGATKKTPISRVGLETNKHNWGSPHCSNLHILYLVVYYGWWYRRYGSSGTLTLWKMVPFFGSMIYVISKKMKFHSRLLKYHRITKDIMGTDLVYSPPKKCLKKKVNRKPVGNYCSILLETTIVVYPCGLLLVIRLYQIIFIVLVACDIPLE
jgi:hypothetical protein